MNTLHDATQTVRSGQGLELQGARAVMERLVSGEEKKEDIQDFLLALNERGFDETEIVGFAQGLRDKAVKVSLKRAPVVDTCGTGGDGLHTVNISTAAAFVVAGAGVAVAKHGNRSVSSRCGSADVLEALGVPIDLEPDAVAQRIETRGFGFFFAPRFHPAMKHVGPARRAVGVRTIFNLLGPMANPAGVTRQVVGVFDDSLIETYAKVLIRLGAERAIVVRGEDGMDEISPAAPTRVCIAEAGGKVKTQTIAPESFSLTRRNPEELRGGDAKENAAAILRVLEGEKNAVRDAVVLNAGAALFAAGAAGSVAEGVAAAGQSVDSGRARQALREAAQ